MTTKTLLRLCVPLTLLASGALVSAQVLLPSVPPKQFGGSVTAAFEGWYDNPDGTHSFLIGYFSRNTESELDIPIGPNNHFEPGSVDMGQPTHFLPGRRYGMFTYTVPKEFTRTQKLSWVLVANGVTTSVPFYMSPDYNVTPFKSSEESPGGGYNVPPVLRFTESGLSFQGPVAGPSRPFARTAAVGVTDTARPSGRRRREVQHRNERAHAERAAAGERDPVEVPRAWRGDLRHSEAEVRDAQGWEG